MVDDNVILRSDLERAIANIRAQYADRPNMLPPPAVLERQVDLPNGAHEAQRLGDEHLVGRRVGV